MISDLTGWVQHHAQLFQLLGVVSLILLLVTLVALPVIVIKLPGDYFVREKRQRASRDRKYPMFWGALSVAKNTVGLVLILAGLAMLVLPGQGLVTILIGLTMTNFPGKYALERWIVRLPGVGVTLNKIRRFGGQVPLAMPTGSEQDPPAPR